MTTISGLEGAVFSIATLATIIIDYRVFRWNRQNDVVFWAHCTKSFLWVLVMFCFGYAMKAMLVSAFIATVVAGSLSVGIYALAVVLVRRYITRNARRGMAAAMARLNRTERQP